MSIGNWEPKKRNTPYKPNDRFQQRRIYEDNNRLRSENEELRQRLNYLEARLQGSILSQPRHFRWNVLKSLIQKFRQRCKMAEIWEVKLGGHLINGRTV